MPTEQTENNQKLRDAKKKEMERQFLDGFRDEEIGVYREMFSAKSQIEGQDGGIVTTLLLKGIHENIFDVAIVVHRKKEYNAEVIAATTKEEILAAKGTIYYRINVTKKLRELLAQGKTRIAVVGTSCEVTAVRKLQQTLSKNIEITVIGLFCFGAFNPQKLQEKTKAQLGIDLNKATKIQIKQGKFSVYVDNKEHYCKIKDISEASERICSFCNDFVSRLADISIGSTTNRTGYSTVIVRSKKGTTLVSNLDVKKKEADRQGIAKLVQLKREQAKRANHNPP
ncbi:MAG: Coenzyme F420 hydrogenase/dehydrogenase, beta subunit C-terminal domain [Nitrososphaerota archaeon]|jgi:coenzyme F420 hydrogenase subunit beta|nr:Coenzyme F420 hydrogenase/dehydrogenase, beta subunit C-terminal domain [Nitrososphaerota archaeon]